ncbi:ABC transporter permease [Paenibacillus eucommiae]|uniref:Aldouronate transport system permease protein n=1 Tax=Paenibacillus eucommiae TaxID=1355755 RepID=A0ABS4INZ0_9BACL|nr:ABC transporter permease subunit [Paenibacillus eucommiae]MBP1988646.1 putative aldouronate transport system permease protein [Paenibacillus eucommiae]
MKNLIRNGRISDSLMLWLIALPGILYFVIFKYVPLLGNVIAFQDYSIFKGILESPFVGWKHFVFMFQYEEFIHILKNTVILSFYQIVVGFPAPLFLALLLNEIRLSLYKRTVQTLLYLPHFLSWVIVGGVFINLLSLDGLLNQLIGLFGISSIDFITDKSFFRSVVVLSSIWKEVGWGMIIYLAAMSAVNPHLYEAAVVDGAGRWRQMWSITLPSISPAIITLFLLQIGNLLDANVEQMLVLLNPLVRPIGEVIDTYVYRAGLLGAQFSFTTAIGLFKSLIGLCMIVSLNRLSKRMTGNGIY